MKKTLTAGLVLLAVLARAPQAVADTYTKQGTAAANPEITTQFDPSGSMQLDAILGHLTSNLVGDERATRWETPIPDIFQIFITGGGSFSASTANDETEFDTRLYLFDASWRGVYYNDDDADFFGFFSTLPADDALTPTAPGLYYLAVAPWGLTPQSASGAIFPDVFNSPGYDFTDVAGPTGPGGADPLVRWTGAGDTVETGAYRINLTGARFAASAVPEPATLVLIASAAGAFLLLRRRRIRRGLATTALWIALSVTTVAGIRAAPEANTIASVQKIQTGVEIEVRSTRTFGVHDDLVLLQIGDQKIALSRPPADGDLGTLIFFLTPNEWAKAKNGDRLLVYYAGDDPKDVRERWDFGPLNKAKLGK